MRTIFSDTIRRLQNLFVLCLALPSCQGLLKPFSSPPNIFQGNFIKIDHSMRYVLESHAYSLFRAFGGR